ncbi:MAG: Bax inhibitor-1/YccA family protein [Elusimicrobiota bacterium]|nr:Bax inhibitor-1/YccA family protein [Elusimicrobiota bacterium]
MSYSPPGLMSAAETESREFIQKVYAWMSVGLAVTGSCALYMASDPRMIMALVQNKMLFYGLLIAQLGLVVALAGWIKTMEVGTARFAFLFYSALTGVTISVIFLIYTNASIATTFFLTGGMFGAMSLYGYTTKTDLTSIGNFCMMGLIGIILASVVNWWVRSSAVEMAVSYLGILIFVGLTAYDTQKIKKMNVIGNAGTDEDTKEAIRGALTLYLDFINLFMSLLRATGRRR